MATGSSRWTRPRAEPMSTSKADGPRRVSSTAISLFRGNCPRSQRPNSFAASSRVRFSARYCMRGAASNTSTAATGASWLPIALGQRRVGRAKANAKSAIAPARSRRRSRCRNRSRRWFVSCRRAMKRNAGNSSRLGFCRMIRCSAIGTPTRRIPASSAGVTKVMLSVYPRALRLTKYPISARSNCMLVSNAT